MRDCLGGIINENCLLTIAEMNRELRLRLPHKPVIHDRTVARALEGMLYRVKLARPLPADGTRPDVLQKRVEYGNWFMGHAVVNHTVFIDECGYNIWTVQSQGRALRGERAYRQVCGQRERNVTVALAISPTSGLVFHSAILGGMNGRRFDDDGAPAHRNPAIPGPNSELIKLPPYSSFLNIVEQAVRLQ